MVLVRSATNEKAQIKEGPNGFGIAEFKDGKQVETEVTNLSINYASQKNATPKAKPKAKTKGKGKSVPKKKKKKKNDGSDDEEYQNEKSSSSEEEDLPAIDSPQPLGYQQSIGYNVMYYKRNNKCGIRQKAWTKAQICSFGSPNKTEDELRSIAVACINELTKGDLQEDGAKDWCIAKLNIQH